MRIIPVPVFDLVIFGASGDLAQRKILPAMFHRCAQGQLPEGSRIIGSSRSAMTDDQFKAFAKAALVKYVDKQYLTDSAVATFIGRLSYITAEATSDDGWIKLEAALASGKDRPRIFYLSVGANIFGPVCDRLGQHGLVTPLSRVVVEKPLGYDGASADALINEIGRVFPESATFRIDHYLGKETVQNLLALRFANALFEPLWNSNHIDHVQFTVAETVGLEGRIAYYDTAGAIRDMVQNHMLQLLCLTAMEPPVSMEADAVRDEKLQVLKSLKPLTDIDIDRCVVRGQYGASDPLRGDFKSYGDELGNPNSTTETFVALKAEIANWRWAGVPFYFRTGKRLAERVSEILVQFKRVPHNIFTNSAPYLRGDRMVIRLQPDEGVKLWMNVKEPGPGGMRFKYVPLDMSFAEAFHERAPEAYERLIMDVVRGDQTLFMRRDEVAAAWRYIDPIINHWKASYSKPEPYASGTWGPEAAMDLIERDRRHWHQIDKE